MPLPQRPQPDSESLTNQLRSKELDAREQYVKECEKTLKDTERQLKILDTSITAKENQLHQLTTKIKEQEEAHKDKITGLQKTVRSLEQDIEKATNELSAARSKLEQADASRLATTQDIKKLERESADRAKYMREQENLISEAVNEGNVRLKQLQYEVEYIEGLKKEASIQLLDLNNQKIALIDEIGVIADRHSEIKQGFERQQDDLDKKCVQKAAELKATSAKLQLVNAEINAKIKQLQEKEQSILAKQAAIRKERDELYLEKRRFEGTKSLYGS